MKYWDNYVLILHHNVTRWVQVQSLCYFVHHDVKRLPTSCPKSDVVFLREVFYEYKHKCYVILYIMTSRGCQCVLRVMLCHSRPLMTQGIIDFLRPGNITALFVGLINQLNIFMLEVAMKMNPFRGLLKKGAAFQWLPEHTAAFENAKWSLVHHVHLHHFDRSLPHLPSYRCIKVPWVEIHACAAQATRQIMSCDSMWSLQPKASWSLLHHHWTQVPGYSVGSREMPILLVRLRWLLDPNQSSATDWCIPKATCRSCQPSLHGWTPSPCTPGHTEFNCHFAP